MKKQKTQNKKKRLTLREVKIGCSVMDNEGPSAYVALAKKKWKDG